VIVERLAKGPASVSELAAPLPMSLAAVVQHVQVLEEVGLVRTQKTGRVRVCTLETVALERVAGWVAARRALQEERLDRLGTFLEASGDRSDETFITEERSRK
jgi:DNA-binding transcriptional ArsR family regulator